MSRSENEMPPDFGAAELFLAQARAAYDAGDMMRFIAARKMLAVALGIWDVVIPVRRTSTHA